MHFFTGENESAFENYAESVWYCNPVWKYDFNVASSGERTSKQPECPQHPDVLLFGGFYLFIFYSQ